VGQASTQGAGSQARQVLASNPVDSPPDEAIRMPAVSHDRFLCTSLAQAREQEWQPIQRSILGVVKIFMAIPPYEYYNDSIVNNKDIFADIKTVCRNIVKESYSLRPE